MYWTPAKMLILADVGEYSFANAATVSKFGDNRNIILFYGELFETWALVYTWKQLCIAWGKMQFI